MSNTLGSKLRVTVFGQSHAPAIGAVIEGLPAGFTPDMEAVAAFMRRRAPGRDATATARREEDAVEVIAGLNERGQTCGAPLVGLIRNTDTRSRDYSDLYRAPRPGHADFTAWKKFGDARDVRGGGQFSGRLTAPLCFAGALAKQLLSEKGAYVAAHIARLAGIDDDAPDPVRPTLPLYEEGAFPVLNAEAGERMREAILAAKRRGRFRGRRGARHRHGRARRPRRADVRRRGEPPRRGAVRHPRRARRGVWRRLPCRRPARQPAQRRLRGGKWPRRHRTNRHAGILGGITSGMPIFCRVAFKPTPSIAKEQKTVDLQTMEQASLVVAGRHDPCIVPRAVPVVEAVTALVLADMMLEGA